MMIATKKNKIVYVRNITVDSYNKLQSAGYTVIFV